MTQVKIDEVLCLVCDIAAKISAHDTMPGRVIFLVKFLKKKGRRKERWLGLLEKELRRESHSQHTHPACQVSNSNPATPAQGLRGSGSKAGNDTLSLINNGTTKAPLFLSAKSLALYTLIISLYSSYPTPRPVPLCFVKIIIRVTRMFYSIVKWALVTHYLTH